MNSPHVAFYLLFRYVISWGWVQLLRGPATDLPLGVVENCAFSTSALSESPSATFMLLVLVFSKRILEALDSIMLLATLTTGSHDQPLKKNQTVGRQAVNTAIPVSIIPQYMKAVTMTVIWVR